MMPSLSFPVSSKFFLLIVLSILWGCVNEDANCTEYTGVILDKALCTGEKATIIKVTNKDIGSTYKNEKNVILAAMNFDSSDASGTMYMGGVSFMTGDIVYFDFIERRVETVHCPAILGLPSFQAQITFISKNKCL
jgi:hypothetical protein